MAWRGLINLRTTANRFAWTVIQYLNNKHTVTNIFQQCTINNHNSFKLRKSIWLMQTNDTWISPQILFIYVLKCVAWKLPFVFNMHEIKNIYNNSTSLNWFGGLTRSPSLTKSLGSKWVRARVLAGQLWEINLNQLLPALAII